MTIIGSAANVAANRVYAAKGEEIFSKPQGGQFTLFTDVGSNPGASYAFECFGATPGPRELTGSRISASLRAMMGSAEVKDWYTPILPLKRIAVDGDVTGALAKALSRYLADNANFWDRIASEFLVGNPTGADGVALLSDSHPWGANGSTWDNLTTSALTSTSFRAAYKAMTALRDEHNGPMSVRPTHLMVGPMLAPEAMEIVGGSRGVYFDNTGTEAATAVVGGIALPNVFSGIVDVIVNPYMTDAEEWLLMDLSKAGAKPLYLGEQSAPRAVASTDDRDECVKQRGEYEYFVHGAAALVGGWPHLVYGRLD